MKLFYLLVTVVTLAVIAQSINITAVHIANKHPSSGCQLIISNDQQLVDLRTNCALSSSGAKALPAWLQLIDLERAYVLEETTIFMGYRYFKNKLNYKYLPQKLTTFEQTLTTFLKSSPFEIPLPFEESYTLTLHFNEQLQRWSLDSLNVAYAFNHVEKIAIDEQQYTVKYQLITEKTGTTAKNVAVRKLSGKGLHQKVTLKLQLTSQVNLHVDARFCKISIEEILPESSYIDVDQLRSVQHYQVINVEKPQHFSKQYYYRYSFGMEKMVQVGVGKYSMDYPLHFRYPQPSSNNYTRINLHPSDSIVLSCQNDSFSVVISEDPFNDRGFALIFNGASQDAKVVSMITFILMLLAVMVIARQLRKD